MSAIPRQRLTTGLDTQAVRRLEDAVRELQRRVWVKEAPVVTVRLTEDRTSSTTYELLLQGTAEIRERGRLLVHVETSVSPTANNNNGLFQVKISGVVQRTWRTQNAAVAGTADHNSVTFLTDLLEPGYHVVELWWRSTSGTVTCRPNNNNPADEYCSMAFQPVST